MAERQAPHVDAVTGTATTGHEWDGIRELNTPLPRWWLWLFYVTIVWAIGYWIVYPAWPLVSSFTTGMFGWNSRTAVVERSRPNCKAQRAPMTAKLAATSLADIKSDQALADFAMRRAARPSRDNCAPCHGAGGGGAKGYPEPERRRLAVGRHARAISQQTIEYGVRSGHAEARTRARCRPSAATACSSATRSSPSRTTCARSPDLPTRRRRRSRGRQEGLRRQLRGLSRRRRQGQHASSARPT